MVHDCADDDRHILHGIQTLANTSLNLLIDLHRLVGGRRRLRQLFLRLLSVVSLCDSIVSQDKPGWEDGHCPESEVEIDTSELRKDLDGLKAVADGLPSRLSATEKGGQADHIRLVLGQMLNDEVATVGQYCD
jgi:hypothetical protein